MDFSTPPPTHLVYIPAAILVGVVLGFILGRKAGVKEGRADFLAADKDEDL